MAGARDTEAVLDRLELERRQQLALELAKLLPLCLLTGAVLLGALWRFVPQHAQLGWYSGLLVANAAVVWWSGRLFRQGRRALGEILFAASFLVHLGAVPLILPETLLEMAVGYMLVALLIGLVLGARHVAWVALFAAPALIFDMVLGPAFQERFVTPLPEKASSIVSLVLMGFQMLLDCYVLYLVLGSQERLYRQAQQSAQRLSDAQQELLQVNSGLEARVAEQVEEIVAHSKEIEALNVQLQIRVQERSRELVRALSALAREKARELEPGTVFAERVEIERPLGRGGMGVVLLGRDRVTDRPVALKVMNPALGADPKAVQRFVSEADASGAITHPGIVRTLHVDVTDEGRVFLIMEYVEGLNLAERLAREPMSPAEAARFGSCVAEALAAAHEAGVIHRDIKPSNLMLCRTEPGVRVLDFGISKMQRQLPESISTSLTLTIGIMGTPQYMSPEQIRETATVTPATDVYSLGAVLFETMAGRPPFQGDLMAGVCAAHLTEPAPDLRSVVPEAPADIADAIARCLSKEPEDRPAAAELARQLDAIARTLGAPPAVELISTAADPPTVAVGRGAR